MSKPSPEPYSDRAKRLREMAESEPYATFRQKLSDLAKQYGALADRAQRRSVSRADD